MYHSELLTGEDIKSDVHYTNSTSTTLLSP
jgi:hypothetical protein